MKNAKWIPITESLPNDYENVLVTQHYINKYDKEVTNVDIGYYSSHHKLWSVGGYTAKDDEVLAWMPLPEIYKK